MPISNYSSIRDNNAAIAPGNIRHKDFEIQQIINAIRQLMADLAGFSGGSDPVTVGIRFPAVQVPSADPNTLDDYEEGTWTPSYVPSAGAFGSITYNVRNGEYTKIGREVKIRGGLTTTAITIGTAAGTTFISGLPFAGASNYTPIDIWANGFITSAPWPLGLNAADTFIILYVGTIAAGPTASFPTANMNTGVGNQLYLGGTYRA